MSLICLILADVHLDPDRELDERPAFLLGVDLRAVITNRHRQRITEFLRRVAVPERPEHHWLLRAGHGTHVSNQTYVPPTPQSRPRIGGADAVFWLMLARANA